MTLVKYEEQGKPRWWISGESAVRMSPGVYANSTGFRRIGPSKEVAASIMRLEEKILTIVNQDLKELNEQRVTIAHDLIQQAAELLEPVSQLRLSIDSRETVRRYEEDISQLKENQ